jgi:Ca2+-binding EF-hand superfamily protein
MSEKNSKDGLLDEEIEEIKNAFKKYDINKTGKIDVKRFIKEMLSLGFDQKAPIIYKIFTDLDTEETVKKGGVTLDGEKVTDIAMQVEKSSFVLAKGKKKIVKIVMK